MKRLLENRLLEVIGVEGADDKGSSDEGERLEYV